MSKASQAMLSMLSYERRSSMVEDQRKRYAAGLSTREQFEAFVSTVLRPEIEAYRAKYDQKQPRRDDYAPYHTLDAFALGVSDYSRGVFGNPYADTTVNAQAWDRGAEYAMRVNRYVGC